MLILIGTILSSISLTSGLRCYQCEDIGFDTSQSGFFSAILPSSRKNAACATESFNALNYAVKTKTCSSGEVCGLVKGSVTFDIPFAGSVTAKVNVRDCVPAIRRSGCTSDTTGGQLLSKALNFVSSITDIKLNGDSCYCDTDLCVAGGCKGSQLEIGPVCVEVWIIGAASGGLALIIILFIICCCCCCGKKSGPQGTIIHSNVHAPMVVAGYNSGTQGFVAVNNPVGYTPGVQGGKVAYNTPAGYNPGVQGGMVAYNNPVGYNPATQVGVSVINSQDGYTHGTQAALAVTNPAYDG